MEKGFAGEAAVYHVLTWPLADSRLTEAAGVVCLLPPLGPEPLPRLRPKYIHTNGLQSRVARNHVIAVIVITSIHPFYFILLIFFFRSPVSVSGPAHSAEVWSSRPLWLWPSLAQLWPAYTRTQRENSTMHGFIC